MLPWRTADMQVRTRRAGEHHQRSCVAHDRWQTREFRVEWPKDHPMRANWDGRARPIKRIGIAPLQSPIEHVYQPGFGIRRFGLLCHDIHHPPHPHWAALDDCLAV